jgi:diguanylate cyclase (GGDEF)-like protein
MQKEALAHSSILKAELFSNLLPKERQFVADHTGTILLRKGGLLFSTGKKAEHLYLLLEGTIRVFKPREHEVDDEIARFTAGDIIGDFDFSRGASYDANAEALEDSTLVMFPGFGFTVDNLAKDSPHIVSKLLLNSTAMVTARIKTTRKLIIESMSWVQELHRKLHEDPGTGLWKQSFLTEEINRFLEDPMALIMVKPDRFKILVDSLGHDAGDKAMVRIAVILKNATRRLGRGWAIRFRSNETGILINKCDAVLAESLALSLAESLADIPSILIGEENFKFSGSIVWGVWPADNNSWSAFLRGVYENMMDVWEAGGNKVVRYRQEQTT